MIRVALSILCAANVEIGACAVLVLASQLVCVGPVKVSRRTSIDSACPFCRTTGLVVIRTGAGQIFAIELILCGLEDRASWANVRVAFGNCLTTCLRVLFCTQPRFAEEAFRGGGVRKATRALVGVAMAFFCAALFIVGISARPVVTENLVRISLSKEAWWALKYAARALGVCTCVQVVSCALHPLAMEGCGGALQDVAYRRHVRVARSDHVATCIPIDISACPTNAMNRMCFLLDQVIGNRTRVAAAHALFRTANVEVRAGAVLVFAKQCFVIGPFQIIGGARE